MVMIRQHIAGVNIRTKDQAVKAFWEIHRAYNGLRRTDPEDVIEIRQVRAGDRGSWDIYYWVPARTLTEAHARRSGTASRTEGGT
jgi:hypothetical protein